MLRFRFPPKSGRRRTPAVSRAVERVNKSVYRVNKKEEGSMKKRLFVPVLAMLLCLFVLAGCASAQNESGEASSSAATAS